MRKCSVDEFRQECGRYYYYGERVRQIEKDISRMRYCLNGAHALRYDRTAGSTADHEAKMTRWLCLKEKMEKQIAMYLQKQKEIRSWFEVLDDDRKVIVWMYLVDGIPALKLAEDLHMCESSVYRMLNREIGRMIRISGMNVASDANVA